MSGAARELSRAELLRSGIDATERVEVLPVGALFGRDLEGPRGLMRP